MKRGDAIDYNGCPAGYADQPDEVISYVDAHDNETLFDELTYKLPRTTPMAQRVRANTVALSFTALSQTPSFWHAGTDLLRSKSLDRNSYNSGDWFNTLDWTGADNGFGHGLPPKADNQAKWTYQKPLLADPALKPAAAQVATADGPGSAAVEAPLLHAAVPARVGGADPAEGDVPGLGHGGCPRRGDRDADRRHGRPQRGPAPAGRGGGLQHRAAAGRPVGPGLSGAWALSPVQASGADPVVKTAAWDAAGVEFHGARSHGGGVRTSRLSGFAAEPKYRGKLKVVGDGFSDELYGVGIKKGDAAMVEKVNTALKAYIDDGSWKASLNQTVRPSGYKIPKAPTPGS